MKDASVCVCAKLLQLCPTLCNRMDCSPPGSLSMGFSRQEYWSRLPWPPPRDLSNPGSNPGLLCLLQWQAGSLPLAPPRKQELGKWRFRCLFSYKESCWETLALDKQPRSLSRIKLTFSVPGSSASSHLPFLSSTQSRTCPLTQPGST